MDADVSSSHCKKSLPEKLQNQKVVDPFTEAQSRLVRLRSSSDVIHADRSTWTSEQRSSSSHCFDGVCMNGAHALIASLESEGVSVIFGYPGGQAIKLFDALYDASRSLRFVLARHEQAAVHEADGFARSTGDVGVVVVTSGPGATNTVTGIATAYMDSIPLVIITGQVPTGVIGTDSFQESDTFGITLPIVKHSYLLQDVSEITETMREAFHIARSGRPGPVLIDVPSDIAGACTSFHYPLDIDIPSYHPTYRGNRKQIRAAARMIAHAHRPLICEGGGVAMSNACDDVCQLSSLMNIPVVTTLMAKGSFPGHDPLNYGPIGMHGSKFANRAVHDADLLIAIGTRFSDRVTGRLDTFAPSARIIHIDIDPAEIGKVREADIPVVGDAHSVVSDIVAQLSDSDANDARCADDEWIKQLTIWRQRWPVHDCVSVDDGVHPSPEFVMRTLSDRLDPHNSIVTTEVGQHQMWAAQFIDREEPRTFITSGGLGTMGFGFPAAIGAKIAYPDKQVVCVAGDGSFQMNSQEMATAAINGVAVKVLIMDNRCLGMVHQWQELFYHERYAATVLDANPDFVKLADAYGWKGESVQSADELGAALDRMLSAQVPYILDVAISRNENVYPMVRPGASTSDEIGAVDLAVGAVRPARSARLSSSKRLDSLGIISDAEEDQQ
ncbi:MAG: biosynthetic-type acetolactate synthase large subunit [Eggerthellaceae bacterium]|jgi:acetolactate synthase-1/2/3 large subunit|nr:biosynthetic-type acetolactate synthase large subunit [Eggerthellaceae bacterium]MCH4221528.1 biosynthetic-type acetolactate synthase large subunit [Eggerthellaceae bacterium]